MKEQQNVKRVKFGLFSDLHYQEGHRMVHVSDIEEIMEHSHKSGADFVIQLGDFSSSWRKSPEAVRAYLENPFGLPAYGVFGNHDLQSSGNSMETVVPKLNNREVVWGTTDGKMDAASEIAYYHFDVNGIRIVCLDTNFSYNPENERWEHNLPNSYALQTGNVKEHSLGDVQIAWLNNVLNDAADNGIRCIVCSHASFSGKPYAESPSSSEVREIFKQVNEKRKGTVLAALNGHRHATHAEIIDGIFYLDMNVTRAGSWSPTKIPHYSDEHTFIMVKYDDDGNETERVQTKLNELGRGNFSWFFKDPLYTVVSIGTDGKISVEPRETEWIYGVEPPSRHEGIQTRVVGGEFDLGLQE